jgi:hypothetical protein
MTLATTTNHNSPEIIAPAQAKETLSRVEPDQYTHFNFLESDSLIMAQEAWRIHAEGYVAMKFVNQDAVTSSGALVADIDKARGDNVEYNIALNPDDERDCASMRKIHLPEGGSFIDLPAYSICKANLSKEGLAKLHHLESEGYNMKEISALAKTKDAAPRAIFELFRNVIHGSMGRDEAFFFSLVSATHQVLTPRLSEANFLVLGEDTDINDARVERGVKLRPLLTMPDQFIDNIFEAYVTTESNVAKRKLAQSLVFYTDGLVREQMSNEVFDARKLIIEAFERERSDS